LKQTDIKLIFVNGCLGGAVLAMVSFFEIFRDYPELRLFLGLLIGVVALVMGSVFHFSYREMRATNGLRWAFEESQGQIPERMFELNGRQVGPTLAFLVDMDYRLRRHSAILLGLNLLKLSTTLLCALALARWQNRFLTFTLIWTGLAHVWIYLITLRTLKNGQAARLEIFNLLQLHRFSLKKRM